MVPFLKADFVAVAESAYLVIRILALKYTNIIISRYLLLTLFQRQTKLKLDLAN